MICCSVNDLPPTTTVCATTPPPNPDANTPTATPPPTTSASVCLFVPLLVSPKKFRRRMTPRGNEPIRRLPKKKTHSHGQQCGRDPPRKHHPVPRQIDTGKDELAEAPAAD